MTQELTQSSWNIPGIERPDGLRGIPAVRALLQQDDATLVESLFSWCCKLRPKVDELEPILERLVGVPGGEMVASPFAFRASVLGLSEGIAAVHEECRTQGPWPEHLISNEASVQGNGETWENGKLVVHKYASFCQDFPFLSFHPEHSSKWTPHEMIHRVLGFFFRRDMTPFECYLGTRLNESIPVALWYGLDRLARLDEDPEALPVVDSQHHGASRNESLWISESEKALRGRIRASLRHFRGGLEWVLEERNAVEKELRTGRVCPRPGGFLDGSGDAMAYVVAHANRLKDPEVQRVIETHTVIGTHRFETIPDYLKQLENLVDRLLFGPVEGDLERALERREQRMHWDLAMLPLMVEPLESEDEEEDAPPIVPGYMWDLQNESVTDWGQLVEGLESVFPVTLHALGECDPEAQILSHFVEHRLVVSRGPLGARFLEALSAFEAPFVEDLARFEWLLADGLKRSDQMERLGMSWGDAECMEEGILNAHPYFDLQTLPPDMLHYYNEVMGQENSEPVGISVFLLGKFGDDVVMLPAPPPIAGIWLHLQAQARRASDVVETLDRLLRGQVYPESWPQGSRQWIEAMIELGAVSWTRPWHGLVVDVSNVGE